LKDCVIKILRWSIPALIVGWLILDVYQQDNFGRIWSASTDWTLLGLGLLLYLGAQMLTIVRWYWLVRALALPFRWNDAVRLGFLGYLLTFVSLGAVGGDLLKAFFVAREQPGRRVEAFATVIVDRVLGLYSLLLLATVAIVASGMWTGAQSPTMSVVCQAVVFVTGGATAGILLLLAIGDGPARRMLDWVSRVPRLGPTLLTLARAVQVYRRDVRTVAVSILAGVGVQSLVALCMWATAEALVAHPPSVAEHISIVPLAMLTTMLPLPGVAFGALELALEFLYRQVGPGVPAGQGLLVALGFRVLVVVTAAISALVYATNRRQVADVLREVQAESDALKVPA
jgi:uncharacterized protein (TIRG00374 family)